MATNENGQWVNNDMYDTRLLKERFIAMTTKPHTKSVKAYMKKFSTKSQPYRTYFRRHFFKSISFFAFWFPWQPMKMSSGHKIT